MIKFKRQRRYGTHSFVVLLLFPRWFRGGNVKRSLARWLAPELTLDDLIKLASQKGYWVGKQPCAPIEDDIPF